MNLLQVALRIAARAHAGQMDKAGVPYIEHPKFVSSLLSGEKEKAVALLHDVLEDTNVTYQDLLAAGIPQEVVEAVEVLTRTQDMKYEDYLLKVKQQPLACTVKKADLLHNMDISRIPYPTRQDWERLEKYRKAYRFLNEEK